MMNKNNYNYNYNYYNCNCNFRIRYNIITITITITITIIIIIINIMTIPSYQINAYEKVVKLRNKNVGICEACQIVGISTRTFYNILMRMKMEGMKINYSKKKYGKRYYEKNIDTESSDTNDLAEYNYSEYSQSNQEPTVELLKPDGTPLRESSHSGSLSSVKSVSLKKMNYKKPIEKCSKKEIDDELGYFFKKVQG